MKKILHDIILNAIWYSFNLLIIAGIIFLFYMYSQIS